MATLDRSREYGQVYGGNGDTHTYEQDGKLFDHAGDEWGVDTPSKPRIGRPPKQTPVYDQLASQLRN